MGVVFSLTAAVLLFGFHEVGPAKVVLSLLIGAALLESALGICLGCKVFALLMRARIIPASACEECSDIWARSAASVS
jgi:hypothetical protein